MIERQTDRGGNETRAESEEKEKQNGMKEETEVGRNTGERWIRGGGMNDKQHERDGGDGENETERKRADGEGVWLCVREPGGRRRSKGSSGEKKRKWRETEAGKANKGGNSTSCERRYV